MIHPEDIERIKGKFNESLTSLDLDSELRNLIFLHLMNESKTQDTIDLFELLPIEHFVKVIKFFNGRRSRYVDTNMLEDIFRTAILYNEIENHKMSWQEVIARYPEWKIDKNRDRARIARMKNILQKNANKALYGDKI